MGRRSTTNNGVTEFHLSDENVLFDETIHEAEMRTVTELKKESKVLESYEMALASNDRVVGQKATEAEMTALDKMGTWDLIQLTAGRKTVKLKWVFDIKRKGGGAVLRLKARLAAKELNQVKKTDFQMAFMSVLRHSTVWLVLSLSVIQNYEKGYLMGNTHS